MAMGDHVSVRSTNLQSVAYDKDAQLLEVRFTNGGVYQYSGVPEMLRDQLVAASSPGGFFATRIRNGFPATKVA